MSSISLHNLDKRFGDFTAVADLSLEIANGEFVALLGPSGCGKTTTMNMIAGIELPSAGHLLFDGQPPASPRLQKRGIGFVFQNYAIFTHLSVRDNLAFSLTVSGQPVQEIERRVTAMARRMSIEYRLDQKAGSLSVNEMQKLAIGRSAIAEPRVFLLDEPLSNLDASFRAYMRAELKVLQHEFKQTMVYVTHDQVEAMSLADRIAIMDHGKLMQVGPPLDVYNEPENTFVARFVGSPAINLLDGRLENASGVVQMRLAGGEHLKLPPRLAAAFARSSSNHVLLGIRAQDVYTGPRRDPFDLEISGRVDVIERIGPVRVAHVHTFAGMMRVMAGLDNAQPGTLFELYLNEVRCLAFDAVSGQRLDRKGDGNGHHHA